MCYDQHVHPQRRRKKGVWLRCYARARTGLGSGLSSGGWAGSTDGYSSTTTRRARPTPSRSRTVPGAAGPSSARTSGRHHLPCASSSGECLRGGCRGDDRSTVARLSREAADARTGAGQPRCEFVEAPREGSAATRARRATRVSCCADPLGWCSSWSVAWRPCWALYPCWTDGWRTTTVVKDEVGVRRIKRRRDEVLDQLGSTGAQLEAVLDDLQ